MVTWIKALSGRFGVVGQHLLNSDGGHLGKLARSLGNLIFLASVFFSVNWANYRL